MTKLERPRRRPEDCSPKSPRCPAVSDIECSCRNCGRLFDADSEDDESCSQWCAEHLEWLDRAENEKAIRRGA